jgi:phage I-like protein
MISKLKQLLTATRETVDGIRSMHRHADKIHDALGELGPASKMIELLSRLNGKLDSELNEANERIDELESRERSSPEPLPSSIFVETKETEDGQEQLIHFQPVGYGVDMATGETSTIHEYVKRERYDELKSKLGWLTRWRRQDETPCPFPAKTTVMYHDVDCPLEEAFASCYADTLAKMNECLELYERFKDV